MSFKKKKISKSIYSLICYSVMAFELLALYSTLILLRYFEYHDQLEFAINTYQVSKLICWMIVVTVPACWIIQRILHQKERLHSILPIVLLVCILVFFKGANAGVPKRYEKLQIVSLIHQGEYEQVDAMGHYVRKRTHYGGKLGQEDVVIRESSEVKIDGEYYHTGYLYSLDDKIDTDVGMHIVEDMQKLDGNWYRLNLRLTP